jgi:hypothetical protein
MLSDDIALVDEIDFYNGTLTSERGDAWQRIKKFCEKANLSIKDDPWINDEDCPINNVIGGNMIELGTEVKDKVSGFTGIATAKHLYLNGCCRMTIQPKITKDGKLPDAETFDEPQLEVVTKKKIIGDNTTGGPEKYSDKRKY